MHQLKAHSRKRTRRSGSGWEQLLLCRTAARPGRCATATASRRVASVWDRDTWELLSYVVTVIGLPFAIAVFVWERRRERQQEEEELYQRLADEYTDFMKLVLENADLRLLQHGACTIQLTDEQRERRFALFSVLVALFERAFLLVWEPVLTRQNARLWQSWEDFMREWCRRADFRDALPELLEGEDLEFAERIRRIAVEEASSSRQLPRAASPVRGPGT